MKFYIIASFITTFLLLSCKKETEIIPENRWQLTISNIDDDGATLTWNKMIDTSNSISFYKIFIDNKLISDSVINTTYEITNLKHKTAHQLKILAINNHTLLDSCEQSFTTKENFPPINFSISFDSLTSTGVSIFRTNAQDPESKPITYKIYLNNELIDDQFLKKRTRIEGLMPDTQYSVKVEAIDNQNKIIFEKSAIYTNATAGSLLYRYNVRINKSLKECTLYFPKNYTPNANYPLLFYFHAVGGSGWNNLQLMTSGYSWDDAQLTTFREIADNEGIALAFPQADSYDTIDPSWTVDPRLPSDELPFVNQLIDELLSKYSIDPQRVYACGMSSGGFMTFYMGEYISEKLAAIAPVAATPTRYNFLYRKIDQPLPLLVIFGTSDNSINGNDYQLSLNETLDFWTTNNHFSKTPIVTELPDVHVSEVWDTIPTTVTLIEYPDTTNNGNNILYYRMNRAGHWSPFGRIPLTDVHAENVIWNFFKDKRKK